MLIDLLALAVVVYHACRGFRRGLFRLAGQLLILILSLLMTLLMLGPTADLLAKVPAIHALTVAINEKILLPLLPLTSTISGAIERMGLPEPLADILRGEFPDSQGPLADVWPALSSAMGRYLIRAVTWIILLCLTGLIIRALSGLLSSAVNHVPVIGNVNRLAGLAAGLLYGLAISALILFALSLAGPFISPLTGQLQTSWILTHLADSRLIRQGFAFFLDLI
jgi:uncharacterized membrane protein required for colicin V production